MMVENENKTLKICIWGPSPLPNFFQSLNILSDFGEILYLNLVENWDEI